MVKAACYNHIRTQMGKFLADLIPEDETELQVEHLRSLFFGNYMEPDADPKIYDEVLHRSYLINSTRLIKLLC